MRVERPPDVVRPHLAIVHVQFGASSQRANERCLLRLLARLQTAGWVYSIAVVDNTGEVPAPPLLRMDFVHKLQLSGDNSNREFSGWDEGVRVLRRTGSSFDAWVFTNDTLAARHCVTRAKWGVWARALTEHLSNSTGKWLLGEQFFQRNVRVAPWGSFVDWIVTYCFSMSDAALAAIETLSPPFAGYLDCVSDEFNGEESLFIEGCPAEYRSFVDGWLIRRSIADSSQWYRAEPLTSSSFANLAAKARCIVSEHALVSRVRNSGGVVLDLYRNGAPFADSVLSVRRLVDRRIDTVFGGQGV
ncbi:MAG: hypothetical protein RIS35_2384 [Pseudomonadota bacterium]